MYERLDPMTKQQHYQNFLKFFLFITKQQKVEFMPVSVTALANAYHRPVASPLPLLS